MNFTNRIRFAGALTMIGIAGFAGQVMARENIVTSSHREALKTTVTGCQPAVSAIDLDINNVRARLMTGGDMWWNIGLEVAAYEVPKGSGKSSQFAASCWIGGLDQQGQLKVAAQTYRQDGNDYWPGALDANGKITSEVCANWDKFWKIDKSTINKFIELSKSGSVPTGAQFDVITQWPARGNGGNSSGNAVGATGSPLNLDEKNTYAPFVDVDNNGFYDPTAGDYPAISGDQFIWWVVNDAGNVKLQSQTAAMGIEVQNSAFAYATQDFLNNATFYNYRVINRGSLTIDSTFIAVWDDCDLGFYRDDFIGCDTTHVGGKSRGLGIMYNGTKADGENAGFPVNSYGANPPQIGVDFFQGPKRIVRRPGKPDTVETLQMTNFTYFNNDNSEIGNPSNGAQIYNYMTGSARFGAHFTNDFQGPGITTKGFGSGPITNFVFTGDPGEKSTWSECTCGNLPGDRRFIFSSGPFQLLPGAANDITFGSIWASGVGGCPNTDFKTIKSIDDNAQGLFEAGFKTVEGPEAPRLAVTALDKKLVFYIVNDYGSNNYAESYGRSDGAYNDSLRYHQIVTKAKASDASVTDTLYRFEGYRVFQLANGQVTSAEIFDPVTGQVDNSKAYEVFQCDIKNGVSKIINYSKVTGVSDSTWQASIKINGKDSGIKHSFVISQDQFSPGSDKSLINYHTYYFVAIAYAYNNFAPFDPRNNNGTQDLPYLGSAHGTGGINIPVAEAMPNPSNGAMGTTLNADYGKGLVITRVQGLGNGGNYVQLSAASTQEALQNGSVALATYDTNAGPIDVKVVDPTKIKAYDWVFQIQGDAFGTANALYANNIDSTARWTLTARDGNNTVATIYSETDIRLLNEQIIEKYGLSVSVKQVRAPGIEQANGNGYLDSRISFEDASQPWLWGLTDQSDSNFANWQRSGNNKKFVSPSNELSSPCNFNDYSYDTMLAFTNILANFTPAKNSWSPYNLAAYWNGTSGHRGSGTQCGFTFAYDRSSQKKENMVLLNDVNIVFTSDKSLWTKAAVVEMQEDTFLAEGRAPKFSLRRHQGWTGDCSADGRPIYSTSTDDYGTSWFPGYAIDQGTGRRLNIVFGEDSYLAVDTTKMAWYPDSRFFNQFDGSIIFGGKHAVYVLGTKYDECKSFVRLTKGADNASMITAYNDMRWVGVPILNPLSKLRSLAQGIIPTTTTLKFRVTRPYMPFAASDTTNLFNVTPGKATYPYYTFSTRDYAPTPLNNNSDKQALLDRIQPVPNPYYGYSGFEGSRYDTKVKIINLPAKATIVIYGLDGTLVRTLTKSDPNTAYIDWDVRNAAGLPVASGMYLMHVKAEGIGETVLKWFGATRPIDATSY